MRNKKTLIAIFAAIIFTSCSENKYEKYVIVGKNYKQGGMCHDNNREVKYSTIVFISPHVTAAPHHHRHENASFSLTLANDHSTIQINVDSMMYQDFNVLDVVKYNESINQIRLIRHYGSQI